MLKNIARKAAPPATILFLLLTLLWLRTPSQRLKALERYEKAPPTLATWRIRPPLGMCGNDLSRKPIDVVGEALKIGEGQPQPEIQQRVATLAVRLVPEDFRITALPRSAFGPEAKQMIHQLAMANTPDPNHLLLAGIVEDRAAIPSLRQWVATPVLDDIAKPTRPSLPVRSIPTSWTSRWWAASLALARMGDQEAIRTCVSRIKTEIRRDMHSKDQYSSQDFPYDGFAYLDYIRQPESIQALKHFLVARSSNYKRYDRLSDDERRKLSQYENRAFLLLGRSLDGWPIPMDGAISVDTEKVVAWMQTQKRFAIKR